MSYVISTTTLKHNTKCKSMEFSLKQKEVIGIGAIGDFEEKLKALIAMVAQIEHKS